MSFGLEPFWPPALLALFFLAAAVAHLVAYRRTMPPVTTPLRLLLLSIRIAALALFVVILLRPAAESRKTLSRRPRMAVLVDTSRSMGIIDETSADGRPSSRLARAVELFSSPSPALDEMLLAYDVSFWSFSRSLSPVAPSGGDFAAALAALRADGPSTALGDALRDLTRQVPPPELILVVSDGLSKSGVASLDSPLPSGVKVHCLGVGSEVPAAGSRDIAASAIHCPPEAFVASPVDVIATYSVTGLQGASITCRLLADGAEVASKQILVPGRESLVEASFPFAPEREGPVRLEVVADALPAEITTVNNSVATFIDARKGNLKVLYVEGSFRWESKFLRLALESARDVDLRLIVPPASGESPVPSALARDWDVLIIGDLPASAVPDESKAAIAASVSSGKGLLFLAGASSLGLGGYDRSSLAPLVPLNLSALDAVNAVPFVVRPLALGPYASLVEPPAGSPHDVWLALPPLLSVVKTGAPRAGASVLMEAVRAVPGPDGGAFGVDPVAEPMPLLVVEDYSAGRTAVFTGEGTWQWATGAGISSSAERDRAASIHRLFWRRLAFWLARRQERGDITLDLSLSAHRSDVEKPLDLRARLRDADLKPLTDAKVVALVTSGGRTSRLDLWREDQGYKAQFKPADPGDYTVKVVASRAGAELASASTAFVVAVSDVELSTLVARPGLLAILARSTGGAFASAGEAPKLFSDIGRLAGPTQVVRITRGELWSTWPYAIAIVLLLAFEWTLRKLSGLV
jgi:hypothetical protein